MSRIMTQETVGRLAAQRPETKPVMERFGIDYCCGGDRPLEEAIRSSDRSEEEILSALDDALAQAERAGRSERDWSAAPPDELIRHILDTHHVFMREQLPHLDALIEKVLGAHGDRHGVMLRQLQATFRAVKEEIEMHLMKEEQVLFPYIEQLTRYLDGRAERPVIHCITVQNPIKQMEHEHDNAGDALARMRELTSDHELPGDACAAFESLYAGLARLEADLHEHIHLENNILFPRAIQLEDQALDGEPRSS